MASGIPFSAGFSPLLPVRDRAVVELVGRFHQLTAAQIGSALFASNASKTPLDRVLRRLVERRYLVRLGRLVGGDRGGSQQFVYQLGRSGWRLLDRAGTYWQPRAINPHTLAIADCFGRMLDAERAGSLTLVGFMPEPACHVVVDGVTLTPDAIVEVGFRAQRLKLSCFLEVDLGSEHRAVIREKCTRYWRAYQRWQEAVFPYIVFVVPDDMRQATIEQVVAAGPDEAQPLFVVCTFAALPWALMDLTTSGADGVDQQR